MYYVLLHTLTYNDNNNEQVDSCTSTFFFFAVVHGVKHTHIFLSERVHINLHTCRHVLLLLLLLLS